MNSRIIGQNKKTVLALLALVTMGSTAGANSIVDTTFDKDFTKPTQFSGSDRPTIEGNSWQFWISTTQGASESIGITSVNGAKGSTTNVMSLSEPTPDSSTTSKAWWMPQAAVNLGPSVNISTLTINFDFYYDGALPADASSALRIMVRNAGKAATSAYLYGGTLAANTWYHLSMTTSDNGTPENTSDDRYSSAVTSITGGPALLSQTNVAFGSGVQGGSTGNGDLAFQLGDQNGALHQTPSPTVYIDNIVVDTIPEPAAASLLGLGSLTLLWASRFRR